MKNRRTQVGQRGFSLLEILVAFAILALALGVLLRIFGGGARLSAQADERARAVMLAESLLAAVGMETPLQIGESGGEVDDTFRWHLMVTPWQPAEPLPENLATEPYWVELTISWGDAFNARDFTLGTLRLQAASDRPRRFGPRR